MIFSQLTIALGDDPQRIQPARSWLRNRYRVHQRLCMAFPSASRKASDPHFLEPFDPGDFGPHPPPASGDNPVHVERDQQSGFLFRVDPMVGGKAVILVQSGLDPDWDYAFHNARYFLAAPPVKKVINPCFQKGQRLQFRLEANPTRKIDTKTGADGKRRHGRRVPVATDKLMEWLTRAGDSRGFCIDLAESSVQAGYVNINKSRSAQRLRTARFEGLLEVTDPVRFYDKAFVPGIGPAKAFGFGLLSVMRV